MKTEAGEIKTSDDAGRPKNQQGCHDWNGSAAYLGHCEFKTPPTFGPTVQKGIDFLQAHLLINLSAAEIQVPIRIQFVPMLCAKLTL